MTTKPLSKPPAPAERPSLRDVVRDCLSRTASQSDAAEMLLARARRDPTLMTEMLAPFEERAAQAAVASVMGHERRKAWTRPAAPDDRARMLANMAAAMLLDFPLPGGKRLRAAGAADLAAAAKFYRSQSADMAHKARWLDAVRARLGDAATVAQALDEAALRKLQRETEDAA